MAVFTFPLTVFLSQHLSFVFLQGNLGNVDSWDFDVFAFRRMTKGDFE